MDSKALNGSTASFSTFSAGWSSKKFDEVLGWRLSPEFMLMFEPRLRLVANNVLRPYALVLKLLLVPN